MKEDTITIYWSPAVSEEIEFHGEMNMIYENPENLYDYSVKNKSSYNQFSSMITCPSFKNKMKNIFVFKNGLHSKYSYNTNENGFADIETVKENSHQVESERSQNLSFGPTITVKSPYIFFADKSLIASFTQPFFHFIEHSKYGAVVPGSFDIGSWFRPFSLEFQMWQKNGLLEIKENDPLFYVEFLTDKKIKLVRFKYNKKLATYARHCADAPSIFGFGKPLSERYKKFNNSSMNKIVLNEILNNIVEENI